MHHSSPRGRLMETASVVIQPWDYVRMRREAAGLSIEQAARPYWHHREHQWEVERLVGLQEEVGYHPTSQFSAEDMSRAYPFSVAVYEQLCMLPPEQHPRLCLTCGWDQWTSQTDLRGDDVRWSRRMPGHCTRCAQIERGQGGR